MKKRLLSFALCMGVFMSCFTAVGASAGVVSDITVYTTLDSSQSISQLTANDEYKVYDTVYPLNDTTVNRMASEHFQIIWGDSDTTGEVNYAFVKGNLINLENIRSFYIDELGMKDIGVSPNPAITEKRKTNIYISGTGLTKFEDDWAYMSVDSDSMAYLFVAPGAMRVDEPSWVLPHELAHAFTYHQGGTIPGAWYESTANWFRDTYLGSEYYAYGGKTYGPTSDFFTPYARYSNYYVPHMLQWYDTWPLFTYIAENPDNIEELGMPLMHKIFEYNAPAEDSMFTTIEKLSGVSAKEVLAGFTRRMANYDFSRREFYLMR
ncbi:MAG: dockerin, partial [Firmicutes bacterium]|nr:dockerin [Bacillota bacterium]